MATGRELTCHPLFADLQFLSINLNFCLAGKNVHVVGKSLIIRIFHLFDTDFLKLLDPRMELTPNGITVYAPGMALIVR